MRYRWSITEASFTSVWSDDLDSFDDIWTALRIEVEIISQTQRRDYSIIVEIDTGELRLSYDYRPVTNQLTTLPTSQEETRERIMIDINVIRSCVETYRRELIARENTNRNNDNQTVSLDDVDAAIDSVRENADQAAAATAQIGIPPFLDLNRYVESVSDGIAQTTSQMGVTAQQAAEAMAALSETTRMPSSFVNNPEGSEVVPNIGDRRYDGEQYLQFTDNGWVGINVTQESYDPEYGDNYNQFTLYRLRQMLIKKATGAIGIIEVFEEKFFSKVPIYREGRNTTNWCAVVRERTKEERKRPGLKFEREFLEEGFGAYYYFCPINNFNIYNILEFGFNETDEKHDTIIKKQRIYFLITEIQKDKIIGLIYQTFQQANEKKKDLETFIDRPRRIVKLKEKNG